jgi:DNA-binding phage protein
VIIIIDVGVDTNKLLAKMALSGINKSGLASKTALSKETITNVFSCNGNPSKRTIMLIGGALNLKATELTEIFFADYLLDTQVSNE